MASAGYDAVRSDLERSIEITTAVVGRSPRYLAYPFGYESQEARAAVEAVGLDAAFTIDAPHDGPLAWERVQITPFDGPLQFALKASGRYLALRHSPPLAAGYRLVKPLVGRMLGRARNP
jgi:peptidoglycan/xylan/chitin deacetylase (PgdA/CDA1 family)